MLKSIIVTLILIGSGFFMSAFLVGYPVAGKKYISKQREKRKSLRYGSAYFIGGARGFRGGK